MTLGLGNVYKNNDSEYDSDKRNNGIDSSDDGDEDSDCDNDNDFDIEFVTKLSFPKLRHILLIPMPTQLCELRRWKQR